MTHAEYVAEVRRQIVEIAQGLIDEKLSFIEGAQKLCSLRQEAEIPEQDADFDRFIVIESETDALPIPSARHYWSETALKKLTPEIEHAEQWARETGLEACHALVARFGV